MIGPGEIDKLFIELDTRLRNYKKEFAMEFQHRVEEKTPVVTGALKKGWVTAQKQTGFELSNVEPYAAYVEWGTEKMAPRGMIASTMLEVDQISEIAAKRAKLK
jgi:hypothetical protein